MRVMRKDDVMFCSTWICFNKVKHGGSRFLIFFFFLNLLIRNVFHEISLIRIKELGLNRFKPFMKISLIGSGCIQVVEHLSNMFKVLGSVSSTTKKLCKSQSSLFDFGIFNCPAYSRDYYWWIIVIPRIKLCGKNKIEFNT